MLSRFAACAVVFAVSAMLVAHRAEPATAQGKDTKKDLNQQLKAVRADLVQANQQNASLRQENAQLRAAAKKDEKNTKALQTTIDGFRGAGLVHVVVLKAKAETTDAQIQNTIDESYSQLTKIKPVRGFWAGKPTTKETPEASTDYTIALVLVFDDAAGLKSYLNDSVHTKFTDKHLKRWETPVVYDFEPRKPKP